MGMPIIVYVVDGNSKVFKKVFDYFKYVDEKFSPYKQNSEVTLINNSKSKVKNYSSDMQEILKFAEKTKKQTNGFFDINRSGYMDPSGIVKGWAIYEAAKILDKMGYENYYVDAGGDMQTNGLNTEGKKWAVGIRNPFIKSQNIKVVYLSGEGIATSGTYEKGNHIYLPANASRPDGMQADNSIVSLTVIGPNVYEADRFSTPAFAMGKEGINFIEKQKDLEGYMINSSGIATMTSGFEKYTYA